MDLTDTIVPKSDQLNADDLMSGPRTFTIEKVERGSDEQPVNVYLAEFPSGRPWRPSKSMLRVLVMVWGKESSAYVGRRLTLYRDPEITFGPTRWVGCESAHMSHITKRQTMALTVKRGSRKPFTVEPLPDTAPTSPPVDEKTVARLAELRAEWATAETERKAEIQAEVTALKAAAVVIRAMVTSRADADEASDGPPEPCVADADQEWLSNLAEAASERAFWGGAA
jgi:hypothetical protein